MEILFEFLFELVVEIVGETLFVLGLDSDRSAKLSMKGRHPALIALGYVCIGFFIGVMSVIVWRRRVADAPFALINLAGAPILVGTLMLGFGVWRRMKGKTTTSLATFWGGAAFAFGIALARFLLAS